MLGHYQILTVSNHVCKDWIGRSRNRSLPTRPILRGLSFWARRRLRWCLKAAVSSWVNLMRLMLLWQKWQVFASLLPGQWFKISISFNSTARQPFYMQRFAILSTLVLILDMCDLIPNWSLKFLLHYTAFVSPPMNSTHFSFPFSLILVWLGVKWIMGCSLVDGYPLLILQLWCQMMVHSCNSMSLFMLMMGSQSQNLPLCINDL